MNLKEDNFLLFVWNVNTVHLQKLMDLELGKKGKNGHIPAG